MARDYQLNIQAAREVNTGGKRITEAGKYIGKFKSAWYEKNDKGTESVHFIFVSNDGQEAGPLALYTHNGNGDELPSYAMFNAILTVLQVRTAKAAKGRVELYDYDSKSNVIKDKEIYPDLIGKPIGLLLRKEEYEKRDGDIGTRMIIVLPFSSESGRTANEVLDKAEPKSLANAELWLSKNPVKSLRVNQRLNTVHHADASNGFVDDDIPFAPIARRAHW